MAQSIAKAIKYLKEPAELERTLKQGTYTADLVVSSAIFVGTNNVKYQHIEFDSYDIGTFNKETGYTRTGIVATWKDLILTQDKGNSIYFDIFEDEEATALGIVTFANRYILKVQAPSVDKYRFNVITSKVGVTTKQLTLTTSNVLTEILTAFATLKDNKIDTSALILYINPMNEQVLREAAVNKGYYHMGNWNGQIDTEVQMFDTAKLNVVPSDLLGTGVQFILVHKDAVPCFEKYAETVYFNQVPGFGGRRHQADIGLYHDAFVYDELVKAVYVSKVTAG